ncbi:MAG: hypothetical protein ACI8UO_005750 [Verrucomicrobiales bacterium]|jgi:hypothetical protein
MSFETLEMEAASLPSDERKRLIAKLVSMQRLEDDPSHPQRMAAKLDDTDESRWISEDRAKEMLGLLDQ